MTHYYEIRIEGYLDTKWQAWFDGMSVTQEADGTTLLTGPVLDQPALYGMLRKVRDLGLTLISVNETSDKLNLHNSNEKRRNKNEHKRKPY